MRDAHGSGRGRAAAQTTPAQTSMPEPELTSSLVRAGLTPPQAAPDLQVATFAALLHAAAAAPGRDEPATPRSTSAEPSAFSAPGLLRRRLLERVARSASASRTLHTQRHADTQAVAAAPGVTLRRLYTANAAMPGALQRRPGEPEAVTLVELAPGATWAGPGAALQREWLVLRGNVHLGTLGTLDMTRLEAHDYHVVPAGSDAGAWCSEGGVLLYQRETRPGPAAPTAPWTQRAEGAQWSDYSPGIKRRLMWQEDGAAAMLYHALPGATVPHHGHRHDEECFMLAGDFFLDEVLLRALDYQIAPAGTEHISASTDTGLLLYARGDVDLDLKRCELQD